MTPKFRNYKSTSLYKAIDLNDRLDPWLNRGEQKLFEWPIFARNLLFAPSICVYSQLLILAILYLRLFFLSFFQGNNVCSIEHHHFESFLSSCLLSYHADYQLVLSSLISSDLHMLLVLMYAKLTDLRIRGTLQRQLISAQPLLIIVESIQSIESLQEIDVNGKFSLIYILTIEPLILFQPS